MNIVLRFAGIALLFVALRAKQLLVTRRVLNVCFSRFGFPVPGCGEGQILAGHDGDILFAGRARQDARCREAESFRSAFGDGHQER